MTYRQYDPNKDTLKEGVRIRLAGLELKLSIQYGNLIGTDDSGKCLSMPFDWFPDLEIADEPLTISKRLKEEIESFIDKNRFSHNLDRCGYAVSQCVLEDWLNSLEEVD